MSTERPLQTRPDFDPDQPDTGTAPNHVPEYTERTDTFNPSETGHDRRRLGWAVKLGVPVAALAVAGSAFFGAKNILATNHNPDASRAGNRPVATATANPGQTHETSPAAPAFDPNNYKTWTADHVPLELVGADGNVDSYDSVSAYSETLMVPGASLEDLSKNPQAYADKLLASVNSYIASVSNPQAYEKYANVPAPNANSIGSTGAVLDQYVKPAFEQAVVGSPEKGATGLGTDNTQQWLEDLNTLAHNYNHYNHVTDGKYKAEWKLSSDGDTPPVVYTTYDPNTGTIHISMRVNLVDNLDQTKLAGQQNADGSTTESLDTAQRWNMEVQQQQGPNGQQIMRIISMSADQQTM